MDYESVTQAIDGMFYKLYDIACDGSRDHEHVLEDFIGFLCRCIQVYVDCMKESSRS